MGLSINEYLFIIIKVSAWSILGIIIVKVMFNITETADQAEKTK